MLAAFVCVPRWPINGAAKARSARPSMCSNTDVTLRPPQNCEKLRFPDFVPDEAIKIRNENALQMLRDLTIAKVPTSLGEAPLATVHIECSPISKDVHSQRAAPAVLLLHGFDSNCLEFRNLFPLLYGKCHTFVLDMLGWGLTEKKRDIGYGPAQRREHLHAYWKHVINRPVTLVGASIGGAVAIDFAQQYPEAVEKLVLIDAQAYQDRPLNPWVRDNPAFASFGAEVLRSDWLRWLAIYLSYEDKLLRNEDTLRMGGLHCRTDGWKEAMVDFIRGEGYCLSGSVKDIDIQTLVVWGMKDRILSVKNAARFKDDIRRSTLAIIEDSGHSPHLEQPEKTAALILDFLFADGEPGKSRQQLETVLGNQSF